MARVRSPNYPQISLPAAIERVKVLYKIERQGRIDREAAVRVMGFGGYNGASAPVLSALLKYGLLEASGDNELRVSDLAVKILHPHDDAEHSDAIREAAGRPPLFVELNERWPDGRPSDHSLRTFLTRRGFSDSALDGVIKSYTETLDLVTDVGAQYADSGTGSEDVEVSHVAISDQRGASGQLPAVTASPMTAIVGPGLNVVPSASGYIIHLSGSVATKDHVEQVVTMLNALKPTLPDRIAEQMSDLEDRQPN